MLLILDITAELCTITPSKIDFPESECYPNYVPPGRRMSLKIVALTFQERGKNPKLSWHVIREHINFE